MNRFSGWRWWWWTAVGPAFDPLKALAQTQAVVFEGVARLPKRQRSARALRRIEYRITTWDGKELLGGWHEVLVEVTGLTMDQVDALSLGAGWDPEEDHL